MYWLYDTHVHLTDPQYLPDLEMILQNMKRMNARACCVSMDAKDSERTLRLAGTSDLVLPFVGVHPEKASEGLDAVAGIIGQNAASIAGIGEIGLDPTYCKTDADSQEQRRVFEGLLSLAEKHGKPVSIHSRKSLDEVLAVLSSFSLDGACLHWFDGNKKQLKRAMEMGLFVSYGPVTVYANDKQSLLSRTAGDRILVETDGPVRFAGCFGLRTAQVGFIPSVVFCASKVLQKSYDETCALLEENSRRFLGI